MVKQKRFRVNIISTIVLTVVTMMILGLFTSTNREVVSATRQLLRLANPIIYPTGNTHTAQRTTAVSITYDEPIDATTVSTRTFAVHAMQTGQLMREYSVDGGTIILTPTQIVGTSVFPRPFKPGELVQVSATTSTLGIGGQGPISPTVWQFRTAVSISGSGYFTSTALTVSHTDSRAVAFGDIDGDGDLDALVANINLYTVSGKAVKVYLNDGTGTFKDSSLNFGDMHYAKAIALGDLDGDGDLDAFVVTSSTEYSDSVWLNNGHGEFMEKPQDFNMTWSDAVALGDVDGDADLDAIVAISGGSKLWLNDGTGTFYDSYQNFESGHAIALGDLDGDNDLDAFFAYCGGSDHIWFNDGTGVFTKSNQTLSIACNNDVALGDLDGDGDLDAFITCSEASDTVWMNDGSGLFSKSDQVLPYAYSQGVALGDLDGDGDLDAFVASGRMYSLVPPGEVLLNDGMGIFHVNGQDFDNPFSMGVAMGDVDGDGDLDIYIANDSSSDVLLINILLYKTYLPYVAR